MSVSENQEKKCISVNVPISLFDKITRYKDKIGKSQNSVLVELIGKGLDNVHSDKEKELIYFFVKVRIDTSKMMELGQKLQSGELDTSNILMTYCIKDDPTVGLNIWQAESQESFEEVFAHHKKYYKDVIEIIQVVTPGEAMKLIIERMKK